MTLVLPALGTTLLAVLFMDVLFTVFHPQGRGGLVHQRLNRLVWRAFRLLATRRDRAPRSDVLALAGPLMAVLSVATWGAWLVLGFALVYAPYIATFTSTTPHAASGWIEAVYYSGYVASTLGLGDVVASTPVLRLVTVLEAMSGFALFTVTTAYVLAIFRELAGARTLAFELASLFRGEAAGPALWRGGADETMARWTEAVSRSLVRVVDAHGQYPIMHYFRPQDPDQALVIQLGTVLILVEREAGAGEGDAPTQRTARAFRLLREALMRYLIEMNRQCVPARFDPLQAPLESHPAERLHARLLRYLGYVVAEPGGRVLDGTRR